MQSRSFPKGRTATAAERPDRSFAPGGTPYGTAQHTKRRSHANRSIGAGMPVRCADFHWTAGRAGDSPAAADSRHDSEALPRAVPRAGIRDCFGVPPARNVRRMVGVRRVAAGYSQRPAQCQCGSVTACGLRPGQHVHGPCQVERVSFRLSRHRGSRRPVPSSLFSHNEGPTNEQSEGPALKPAGGFQRIPCRSVAFFDSLDSLERFSTRHRRFRAVPCC